MKKEKNKNRPPKQPQSKQHPQPKSQFNKSVYFDIVGLGIIILLGIIIYSNSFNCSFHFDDQQNIIDNLKIRNLFDVKALWNYSHNRFIPYFTFAINYHFDKLNVWGYHLFNLIIHLINACLVWWLTLLIFSSPNLKNHPIIKHKKTIAVITALLFVSHPLATQSVTYIVQRMASMAALFYFLSLALYMKARLIERSNTSKYFLFAGSFVSAVLAILSKENAYTLPFAVVLFEIFFLQTKKLSINFKDYRVLLSMAALLFFILFVLLKFSLRIFKTIPLDPFNDFRTVTSLNYLFTQFSVIVKYIQLLFFPINQNFDYDFPISNNFLELGTILSFLLLLSLIILAIFLFKRNRIISFCIFWFFLTLSVESSIIPISDVIFEHRTYLPSFGFFLIISTSIYGLLWNKYKYFAISIYTIIILSNSILTYDRNKEWKDEFTLWNDVVIKSPNKARPYHNRAMEFANRNKYNEALSDYTKAIKLNPNEYLTYNNRGNIFRHEKRYNEALADYTKTIKLNPKYNLAYVNRGNVYTTLKENEKAINDFNIGIELNPDYALAYNNRGILLGMEKRYEEALKDFNKAIELDPNYSEAYYNRGASEFNSDEKDIACKDFQKAINMGYQAAENFYNKNCH